MSIQGKCPKCGNDLEYEEYSDPCGEARSYYVSCASCKFRGREWYKEMYDGIQEGPDQDGQYHTIEGGDRLND